MSIENRRKVGKATCGRKKSGTRNYFRFLIVDDGAERVEAGDEHEAIQYLELLERLLKVVASSTGPCIEISTVNKNAKMTTRWRWRFSWGEAFLRNLSHYYEDYKILFYAHQFSPKIEAYIEIIDPFEASITQQLISSRDPQAILDGVCRLNSTLLKLRVALTSKQVKDKQKNAIRNKNKCFAELVELGRRSFSKFSRVLSIRVDLGYRKIHSESSHCLTNHPSFEEAIKHKDKFIRLVKAKYKNSLAEFAWVAECGLISGYHFHVWIILNGHNHQSDISIGKLLGEIWLKATNSVGRYHNCNQNKHRYIHSGLGMLRRGDVEAAKGVACIANYMAKTDFYLSFSIFGRRTFGKSTRS